jgi:hypothetical protein
MPVCVSLVQVFSAHPCLFCSMHVSAVVCTRSVIHLCAPNVHTPSLNWRARASTTDVNNKRGPFIITLVRGA